MVQWRLREARRREMGVDERQTHAWCQADCHWVLLVKLRSSMCAADTVVLVQSRPNWTVKSLRAVCRCAIDSTGVGAVVFQLAVPAPGYLQDTDH